MNRTQGWTAAGTGLLVAGLVALAVGPALAGAISAEEQTVRSPDFPTVELAASDRTIVSDAVGDGAVDYEGTQTEWERAVAAWPLPVPEAHPFPSQVPLRDLNEYDWYESGQSLKKASFWYLCAVGDTIRSSDDEAEKSYWTGAFAAWKTSNAGAFAVQNVEAVQLHEGDCEGLPGFDKDVQIATPEHPRPNH